MKTVPKGKSPSDFHSCLFKVIKACRYPAMKKFQNHLETFGLNVENYEQSNVKYDQELKNQMIIEEKNNNNDIERSFGKEIVFGQQVMLLHMESKKFLTVSRENSKKQTEAHILVLTKYPTTRSLFSFNPSLKYNVEGEKVNLEFLKF